MKLKDVIETIGGVAVVMLFVFTAMAIWSDGWFWVKVLITDLIFIWFIYIAVGATSNK